MPRAEVSGVNSYRALFLRSLWSQGGATDRMMQMVIEAGSEPKEWVVITS